MKKATIFAAALAAALAADAALVRLVPEHGVSKAFTLKSDGDVEYVVRFYRPDVFRVQAAPKLWTGDATNRTYVIDYSDPHNDPKKAQILVDGYAEDSGMVGFEDKGGAFTFRTSEIAVRFDKATELMSVETWRGRRVLAEAAPLSFRDGETVQTLVSDMDERIYGGGQQLGRLMHKGRSIKIDCDYNWSDGGAPNPAPFVMSSHGCGILRHTFAPGAYDFTERDVSRMAHSESRFDAFYFVGDYARVLDLYTEATGRPNFLPMWGLELGDADAYMTREKDTKWPKQEADGSFTEVTPMVVERVARKYREADMPCGWLLVNDGYGCGYTELAPVVSALRDLGLKTGLWTEGALDRIAWEVGRAGTRVQKLDVAWTSQGGSQYKNQHALQCNKDAFLGITTNANARGFCWTVLSWAGTQRYGISWAGDEYGGWDLIKYMIPGVTGSAMSGQAYATTDVDGIFGGSNETFLRDIQWKCWTTAMYVMNGWSDVCKSPWSLDEPYRSEVRKSLKHKIRMTPYIYALMRESWETGAPIVAPMAYRYDDDIICWNESTKYQFMLGPDFIVAPVYTSMKVNKGWWRKGVYLPEGEWYDYNDGRRVEGGRWILSYPIDLTKIPVFVRSGAIVPMYDEALTTSEIDRTRVTFDVWPEFGEPSVQRFYEDDGSTLDYRRGAFVDRTVSVLYGDTEESMNDLTVEVGPADGWYEGLPQNRVWEFRIHTQCRPDQVLADGRLLMEGWRNVRQGWTYDADEKYGTVKVRLLPRPNGAPASVTLRFAAEPFRVLTPDYPKPTAEEAEAAASVSRVDAVSLLNDKSIADGRDMVVRAGQTVLQKPDAAYTKVKGSVASHPDNRPEARFTFRVFAGNHVVGTKQIFERANMKGTDVPQLLEVNIPADSQFVRYEFTADDESEASKGAKGVWKAIEYIAE